MENIYDYEAMAKLKLSEDEKGKANDFIKILLDSFNALETVNVDNTSPLVSVLNLNNILREDKADKMISREELLSNAPQQHDGYFQVPKTLE